MNISGYEDKSRLVMLNRACCSVKVRACFDSVCRERSPFKYGFRIVSSLTPGRSRGHCISRKHAQMFYNTNVQMRQQTPFCAYKASIPGDERAIDAVILNGACRKIIL